MGEAAHAPAIHQATQGRALEVLRDDLVRMCRRLRLLRDAFDMGSPTWDELNDIWEDAGGALGGANALLNPLIAASPRNPTLGPPDPADEPKEFHEWHVAARARRDGKMAAANDHSMDEEDDETEVNSPRSTVNGLTASEGRAA